MNDRILHISIEELALEDQFIAWVKDPEGGQATDWNSWLEKHPEQREKVVTARQLVEAVRAQAGTPLNDKRKKDLWQAIEAKTKTAKVRQLNSGRRRWLWSVAAAAVILLVGGTWWLTNSSVTALQTARAETKSYDLPDGSAVNLNAESTVSFHPSEWGETRELSLSGEAFFTVKKGKLFQVKTRLGTVEVLGTSFNVEERNDKLRVHCYTGKVRVTSPAGASIVLLAGDGVEIVEDSLRQLASTSQKEGAWREAMHHFTAVPFSEVVAELERQFDVTVLLDANVNTGSYYGFFSSKEGLEKALQAVCWPLNLQFTVNGKTVEISAGQ